MADKITENDAREAAIHKIANESCDNEGVVEYYAGIGWDAAKAHYQPKWVRIETEADLPDTEGKYLVTASDGYYFVDVAEFKDGWFVYGDVIAWAELPEPYQPEEKQNADK